MREDKHKVKVRSNFLNLKAVSKLYNKMRFKWGFKNCYKTHINQGVHYV